MSEIIKEAMPRVRAGFDALRSLLLCIEGEIERVRVMNHSVRFETTSSDSTKAQAAKDAFCAAIAQLAPAAAIETKHHATSGGYWSVTVHDGTQGKSAGEAIAAVPSIDAVVGREEAQMLTMALEYFKGYCAGEREDALIEKLLTLFSDVDCALLINETGSRV